MGDTTHAPRGNVPGDFVWYEHLSPEPGAAESFYGPLLGWRVREAMPGYRVFGTEAGEVGGLADRPGPARWLGYVAVDDADAAAEAARAAGGAVHLPPTDIPGVGRFALIADPQGVPIYVMRGASDAPSAAFAPGRAGHGAWNELSTTDQEGALAFHTGLMGWRRGEAMPMGALGEYRFLHRGEAMIGAVMTAPPGGPPPAWRFYFGVPEIEAAARGVAEGGGTVLWGPSEVPGGMFALVARDPQGAEFGLVGPRVRAAP